MLAAIERAKATYAAIVAGAKAAYEKGKKAVKEWFKKKIKKDVLACLLACVVFPPSCPGCAARVALKFAGIIAAKIAALYLAYEGLKKKANDNLKKATDAAKCGLAQAYASVS